MNDKIEYYKKEIIRIIKEYFIEPEKEEINSEKEPKSYQIIDENKIINDKSTENAKIYTDDIILIKSIIEKNYINFFHYQNIKNCYKYMKKKYDINNQITIEYEIKKLIKK